jgi:mannosyltransferase OCH1-like enzyme
MQIPLKIYQTWHTKDLSENMKKSIDDLKNNNPEFEHNLFDDNDCRTFIEKNFDKDVLYAYDKLIPKAYKADLWRYCLLYIAGGIYIDICFKPVNNFKFIDFIDKEYFVSDTPLKCRDNFYLPIYNGLIISKPENEILLNCINNIVLNVKNKAYFDNPWAPTGPVLLGKFFTPDIHNNNLLKRYYNSIDDNGISINNTPILMQYREYRKEKTGKTYVELWEMGNIYN